MKGMSSSGPLLTLCLVQDRPDMAAALPGTIRTRGQTEACLEWTR